MNKEISKDEKQNSKKTIKKTKIKEENISNNDNSKKDLSRLVDYYRMRVDNFEKERLETLEKLEKLQLSQQEQHKMEWENKRRKDEIIELQRINAEKDEILDRERRNNLFYQFELENKNLKSDGDRKRLMDILKLAEPIEQCYKLYKDRRPELQEQFTRKENIIPNMYVKSNSINPNNITNLKNLNSNINSIQENNIKESTQIDKSGSIVAQSTNVNTSGNKTSYSKSPINDTLNQEISLRNNSKSPCSIVSKETNFTNNKIKNTLSTNSSIIDNTNRNKINDNLKRNKSSTKLNTESNVKNKIFSNTNNIKTPYFNDNNNCENCNQMTNKTPQSFNCHNYHTYSINPGNNLEFRIAPSDEKQQIVRTIVMPKEEEQLLKQEINYLQTQQKNTRNFYENQLSKLEESRKLKDEETKLQLMAASERIEELMKRNQKLENLNYEITKDYLHLKYDSSQIEKRLYEELELVKLQNESLSTCLKDISKKSQVEKELTRNDFERKNKELSNVLRNQIKNYEDQNNLIKEQYKQVQKVFSSKLADLEERLSKMTNRYKILETKRNNELEGYLTELNMIRRRVKSYEDYVYKLKLYTHGPYDKSEYIKEEMKQNNDDFIKGINKLNHNIDNFEKDIISNHDYSNFRNNNNYDVEENLKNSQFSNIDNDKDQRDNTLNNNYMNKQVLNQYDNNSRNFHENNARSDNETDNERDKNIYNNNNRYNKDLYNMEV